MCGIAGIVHRETGVIVQEAAVRLMCDVIAHRGPDDSGVYVDRGVGLGSRRLAILDLSQHGHMPMSTPDGRYHIVYNGEVYNFQELRSTLEKKGVRFCSNTDTEVLLHLFAAEGPGMLSRLNGMFAFAIWDSNERSLFLVRDRLGIKPLYYFDRGDSLLFGSEEKSLIVGGAPAEFNFETLEELLYFKYVAGDRTPFVGIKRLLPGHYLIWRNGKAEIRRWWNLHDRVREIRGNSPSVPSAWFEETFDGAVKLRRISDVPVGVMLSGGLDSSSIAASLSRDSVQGMASFTVRFAEKEYDEGDLAREVARQGEFEYHELFIPDGDLLERLADASWYNDEPLAHSSSLHILALAEYAKPRVTVLLSGEGSDEVLGGYVRYRPLSFTRVLGATRSILPLIGERFLGVGRLSKLMRYASLPGLPQYVLYNACDIFPPELSRIGNFNDGHFHYREQVLKEAVALYPADETRQAMYLDQHTFLCSVLDRNDRMTMGASIECRVPFLDYRLVEGLAALPSSVLLSKTRNKKLLRQSLGGRLPTNVLKGRKWGFGVPWSRYFRRIPDLSGLVESLPNHPVVRESPLDPSAIRNLVRDFHAGDDRHSSLMYQLVMLAIWHDTYFDRLRNLRRSYGASA